MKIQTTAILLCSLILSTHGHEYLKAHHLTQGRHIAAAAKHHHDAHGKHHHQSHVQKRNNDDCHWVCTTSSPTSTSESPAPSETTSTSSPTESTGTTSSGGPSDTTSSPTGSTGTPSGGPSDTTSSPTGSTGTPSGGPSDTTSSPTGSTGTPSGGPSDTTSSPSGSTGTPSSGGPSDTTSSPTGSTGTPSGGPSDTTSSPSGSTGTPSSGGPSDTTSSSTGSTGTTSSGEITPYTTLSPTGSTGTPSSGGPTGTTSSPSGTSSNSTEISPTSPTSTGSPEPSVGGNGSLTIYYNETTNIVAIVNLTAKVAIVIDVSANLVLALNGTSGGAIIVNIKEQTGIYIKAGIWVAAQVSWEVYWKSIVSLTVVWKQCEQNGVKFSIQSASQVILSAVASIIVHLSAEWGLELKGSVSKSLTILVDISVKISAVFSSSIKVLLVGLAGKINGDIHLFVRIIQGVQTFLLKINGGINVIIEKSVKIKWELILAASSGVEIFVILLENLSAKLSLGVVLQTVLTSQISILESIVILGGNVSYGVTGVYKILWQINEVVEQRLSIAVLIQTIVAVSVGGQIDSQVGWNYIANLSKILQEQIKLYGSCGTIQLLLTFVSQVQAHSWVVAGIKVHDVVIILAKVGTTAALDLIIGVIWVIRTKIAIDLLIVHLFLHFLQLLSSTSVYVSVSIIERVFTNIKITSDSSGHIDIIGQITKQINYVAIVLPPYDLLSKLKQIPILGQIIVSIDKSVTGVSGGSVTVRVVFTSSASSSVRGQIWTWLATFVNISGTGSTSVTTSGSSSVNSSSGGSWSSGWKIGAKHHHQNRHHPHDEKEQNRHHYKHHIAQHGKHHHEEHDKIHNDQ